MGYSQGATDISGAEQTLADFGIPEEDLRIVLIGDPSEPIDRHPGHPGRAAEQRRVP